MLSISRALTVLVVAHNDAQTLLATVDRVYRALTITIEDFSIVIFDDASTDTTNEAAETAAQQYPFVTVRRNDRQIGPGYCTLQGAKEARSDFVVYVPADNTWPLRSFIELFGHMGKADVITSYSNNLLAAMPLPKRILSRAYTTILNAVFRKGMRYYNGLTIYPAAYFAQDPVRSRGFGFQAEALIKAVAAGYSYLEIALPVDETNLPRARSVTLPNAVEAGLTIVRLAFECYVSRRAPLRAPPVPRIATVQSADEIGVAEVQASRSVDGHDEREPLRVVICGASSGIGARLAQVMADD